MCFHFLSGAKRFLKIVGQESFFSLPLCFKQVHKKRECAKNSNTLAKQNKDMNIKNN
jgi:hypothetical protein